MLVWEEFPRGGQGSTRNSTKPKDSTRDSLKDSTRDSLIGSTRDSLKGSARDSLKDSTRDSAEVKDQGPHQEANMGSVYTWEMDPTITVVVFSFKQI